MTDQTVSQTLNWAADLIEARGWTTGLGGMEEHGGPLCLQGAINVAAGERGVIAANMCPAGMVVRAHLDLPLYETVDDLFRVVSPRLLWRWNDVRGRTASEVIEALRACAVIEAAKETADERVAVTA